MPDPIEEQIAALQKQVASLQSSVNRLTVLEQRDTGTLRA
jgi:hypothetical protein